MKLLHLSDIHLGKKPAGNSNYSIKRYEDYFKAFNYYIDYAVANKIDVIIIAGDFFDRKDLTPDILLEAETILSKAKIAQIDIIMIEGNHDNISNINDSWIIYLENKQLIKRPFFKITEDGYEFIPIIINDVKFYGIGYCGAMFKEVIKIFSDYLDTLPKQENILLLHTGIGSDSFLPGLIDSETISLIKDKVIYAAGGHLHSFNKYPKNEPFFFIPGSPEYWDIKESQNQKGGIIFDTVSKEYEFIPAQRRKVHKFAITTDNINIEDIWEDILKNIKTDEIVKFEDIAWLEILLNNAVFIDTNFIEKKMEELGFLKSFIYIQTEKSDKQEYNSYSSTEEIENSLISKWEPIFSENNNIVSGYLEKFKNGYSEKDTFSELFDSMLTQLLQGEDDAN